MLPVSQRFLDALRAPHVVAMRATIEQPGYDPVEVPIIGGGVTIDEGAATTITGSLTLPWTIAADGIPVLGIDLRTLPYGAYCYLERGIRFGDGTKEYAALGRLRINAVSWRSSENVASLELSDRMSQLADRVLPPWTPAGMSAAEAVLYLVNEVFGGSITYTDTTTPGADLVGRHL